MHLSGEVEQAVVYKRIEVGREVWIEDIYISRNHRSRDDIYGLRLDKISQGISVEKRAKK